MSEKVRVRFAPSPTGYLHVGGLRTALYDYIFAKQKKGIFILRIEDTDQTRYVEGAVENLINSLKMMGIEYDEGPDKDGGYGPYLQSQRLDIYRKYIDELIEKGFAYYCFATKEELDEMREEQLAANETQKYDGRYRNYPKSEALKRIGNGESYVVRLRMPDDRAFSFYDQIRGNVEIDSSLVDDQVILKSDGFPTYHLASVVDDKLMEITHVIRGEEWISSTPKHIYLYECFGWQQPEWIHLPLILNPDRSKLSKRQGDVAVEDYVNKGYLPDALVNFVTLLGWHPHEDQEIFPIDKTIAEFSFDRVNKAGAVFDREKLDWMNGWYIRNSPLERVAELAKIYFAKTGIDISNEEKFTRVISVAREYVSQLCTIVEHSRMYYEFPEIADEDKPHLTSENAQKVLKMLINKIVELQNWKSEDLGNLVKEWMKESGVKGKEFYHPLRLALYGKSSGPDIPKLLHVYGKEGSIDRIKYYLI